MLCYIYCTYVRPRKKDPSPVVIPEVCYFPCFEFFLTQFKGLRAEGVTPVHVIKAQWVLVTLC